MSELISGKEVLIALANGGGVEFKNPFQNIWISVDSLTISEIKGGYYHCSDDNEKIKTSFRLKPRTITINGIEVQKPFEPKEGDKVWVISDYRSGYHEVVYNRKVYNALGCWRTEEEIKQVVAALRQVFGGSHE